MNDADFTPKLSRDYHLFAPGPKRILSLDGGGVRGAISVAFLERIEAVLSENLGKPVRLGDYFDLIGGTSTGAIIAGALALGYTTKNIGRFYHEVAPHIFLPSRWRLLRLQSKFDATALREEIEAVVGDLRLGSPELLTGLCIVSKRMDTGSPWILANNPKAPYWKTKAPDAERGEKGYAGNEHYKLANLVRASTAAPFYFDPELLEIVEGEPLGLFVDGGVTPHNNPALILFLMTILKCYKLKWEMGPENLTICSIGTGGSRQRVDTNKLGMGKTAKLAIAALTSLMGDVQTFALVQMQFLGKSLTPWWINSEMLDLAEETPPHGKMFTFMRYDVRLEVPWLQKELGEEAEEALGRKLDEDAVQKMRALDEPSIIPDIYKLAQIAAKKQVKAEHWLGDLPAWTKDVSLPPTHPRSAPKVAPMAPGKAWARLGKLMASR